MVSLLYCLENSSFLCSSDKICGFSYDIVISSAVTIFVTISGFIVTYLLSRKNLTDEILKFKQTSQVDQIKDLAFSICDLMYQMKDSKKLSQKHADKFAEIMNKVVAFGSNDAVNIAIWGQRTNFLNQATGQEGYYTLIALALLISQLKYDASSVIIPADTWFILRINDYDNDGIRDKIENLIIETVDKLNLNKGFYPNRKYRL